MNSELPPCPHCRETMTRIHRALWMRLLPGSRFYRCGGCYRQYLKFIGWFRQR